MKKEPTFDDVKYLIDTLYVIGGKWKLPIMLSLSQGHTRYRDIQRSIPNITSRMLSKELKELELNKIVSRKVIEDYPVRIDYEITDYCKSFQPIIDLMIEWGKKHREYLKSVGKDNS